MSEDRVDQGLNDIAGDPAVARQLKESLNRLAKGHAGPELAEMAREVLDGRTDLRTVARSSAYARPLTEAVERFQRWQSELTDDERQQIVEEAKARATEADR